MRHMGRPFVAMRKQGIEMSTGQKGLQASAATTAVKDVCEETPSYLYSWPSGRVRSSSIRASLLYKTCSSTYVIIEPAISIKSTLRMMEKYTIKGRKQANQARL